MYILLDDKIIQIDLHYINGFDVERVYHNHIDDDGKSGFVYHLVARNCNNKDYDKIIKHYNNKESALEGLKVVAEKVDAIMLDK